jgi:hypothetical protein
MATPIVAPLTGTVTSGTWLTNQSLTVAAMPNGFMRYNVLLPAQYNPAFLYPVIFHGHENDEGMNGSSYPSDGAGLVNQTEINGTYNTPSFRRQFPAIVVVPHCDQSLDTSGANGNANFGGYADGTNTGGNEQAINALVAHVLATWSADPSRFYGRGSSLGAIGVLAWLVDNNALNGAHKIWAAGIGFSDQLFRSGDNTAAFDAMHDVPYLAISTPFDNNEQIYDMDAWLHYTGNTNYPSEATLASGGVAAIKAGTSKFYYVRMTSSQMPWDVYSQLNVDGGLGTPLWTWLFAQSATGVVVVPPPPTQGTNMTVLLPGAGGTLTDGSGNVWSINAAGDVMEGSTAVAGGGGSAALTLVGNVAWALDGSTGGHWYTWAGGIWNDQGPTTKPAVVPNQVASVTAGTVTSSSVALSWAAPILATSYVVQRSTDGGTTWADFGTSSTTSFAATGLASATAYQFRACGVDSTGRGAFSPAASVTTSGGSLALPNAPTGLTVSNVTTSGATLSWTAPTSGGAVGSYVVEDNRTGVFAQVGTTAAITPTFNLTGLSPNTAYQAEVFSSNSTGLSTSASNVVSFTTQASGGSGPTKASVQAQIAQAETLTAQVNALLVSINTNVGLL